MGYFMNESKSGKSSSGLSCYHKHPGLLVGKHKVYGGSCQFPAVKDADIYVALAGGYSSDLSSDPWEPGKQVVEVHYPITDMCSPSNVERFKKMISWLCNQLQEGKKIHIGCQGGHGRTGVVLSALVAQATGTKDAIQYVRKHYCVKAVESSDQVKFLMKHYGVTKVKGHKEGISLPLFSKNDYPAHVEDFTSSAYPVVSKSSDKVVMPMPSARSLWKMREAKQ